MKTKRKHIPHDEFIGEWLVDGENAVGYLGECLASGDKGLFLDAIRRVADAQGIGVRGIAQATGLGRETLYRTLSEAGNPELATITKILNTLGMGLTVEKTVGKNQKRAAGKRRGKPVKIKRMSVKRKIAVPR